MKILVVDDKAWRRSQIKYLLLPYGHEIILARNGKTALTLFARHKPDLVLTDTKMSPIEGPALARELKRIIPNTPVIGMSKREESRKNYAHFWRKDEPVEELIKLVNQLVPVKSPS